MKALFRRDRSVLFQFMLLALLASGMIWVSSRGDWAPRLRHLVLVAVSPVYHVLSWPSHQLDRYLRWRSDRDILLGQIETLRTQTTLMHVQIERLAWLEQENSRLHDQVAAVSRWQWPWHVARVLHVALDAFSQRLTLDVGTKAAVRLGLPAFDAHGVLGQVVEVAPSVSQLLLLTDPKSGIPVLSQRNQLRAVATGHGQHEPMRLSYLPSHADVRVGDVFLTSGLDGHFPAGYPVAKVVRVKQVDSRDQLLVEMQPLAQVARAASVVLLWPPADTKAVVSNVLSETKG